MPEHVTGVIFGVSQSDQVIQLGRGVHVGQWDEVAPAEASYPALDAGPFMGALHPGDAEERVEAVFEQFHSRPRHLPTLRAPTEVVVDPDDALEVGPNQVDTAVRGGARSRSDEHTHLWNRMESVICSSRCGRTFWQDSNSLDDSALDPYGPV